MKRLILHLGCLAISLLPLRSGAVEPIWRYAVEASATVYRETPKIVLSWVADPYATGYVISRKAPADTAWKKLGAQGPTATAFEDTTVAVHQVYEYQIQKNGNQETTYTG